MLGEHGPGGGAAVLLGQPPVLDPGRLAVGGYGRHVARGEQPGRDAEHLVGDEPAVVAAEVGAL